MFDANLPGEDVDATLKAHHDDDDVVGNIDALLCRRQLESAKDLLVSIKSLSKTYKDIQERLVTLQTACQNSVALLQSFSPPPKERSDTKCSSFWKVEPMREFVSLLVPSQYEAERLVCPSPDAFAPPRLEAFISLLRKKCRLQHVMRLLNNTSPKSLRALSLREALTLDCGDSGGLSSHPNGKLTPILPAIEDLLDQAYVNILTTLLNHAAQSTNAIDEVGVKEIKTITEVLKKISVTEEDDIKMDDTPATVYLAAALIGTKRAYFPQSVKAITVIRSRSIRMWLARTLSVRLQQNEGVRGLDEILAMVDAVVEQERKFARAFEDLLVVMKDKSRILEGAIYTQDESIDMPRTFTVFKRDLIDDIHRLMRTSLPYYGPPAMGEDDNWSRDTISDGGDDAIVLSYETLCVLHYYRLCFSDEPELVAYIDRLHTFYQSVYRDQIVNRALSFRESLLDEAASPSTRSPEIVLNSVDLVLSLKRTQLAYREKSMKRFASAAEETIEKIYAELIRSIDEIYNPLVNLCRHLAQKLSPSRGSLLCLNTYNLMAASLQDVPEADVTLRKVLVTIVEDTMNELIDHQIQTLLNTFRLEHIDTSSALYKLQLSIEGDIYLDLVESILSRTLRDNCRKRVYGKIAEMFADVYEKSRGQDFTSTLKPPEEIRAILASKLVSAVNPL